MVTRANQAIEFIVKPKEDLCLEGALRKLPRVGKGEQYPCQMQKNQTFSCLFRHYAKHNGLKKEDLVFYFVDELLPDQTPETVHLMPQDEIWVEHRKQPEAEEKREQDSNKFFDQFRTLFVSGDHSDITFLVGDLRDPISAHKAILSARSHYFEAMFRQGGMKESQLNTIEIVGHEKQTFMRMIEYVYTNQIRDLQSCSPNEIMSLLAMSHEYIMEDLQAVCEEAASHVLAFDNIGRFMILGSKFGVPKILSDACKAFVKVNRGPLNQDEKFRQEIEESPQLGLLLFDACQDDSPVTSGSTVGNSQKRRRITEPTDHHEVPNQAGGANTIAQGGVPGGEPW